MTEHDGTCGTNKVPIVGSIPALVANAAVAQLEEQLPCKQSVAGSIPVSGSKGRVWFRRDVKSHEGDVADGVRFPTVHDCVTHY